MCTPSHSVCAVFIPLDSARSPKLRQTRPPKPFFRRRGPSSVAALISLSAVLLLMCSGATMAAVGRPTIVNKTVVASDGKPLRGPYVCLYGTTLQVIGPADSSDPYYRSATYYQQYKNLGYNSVRVVVKWGTAWGAWNGRPRIGGGTAQYTPYDSASILPVLDQIVAAVSSLDMYVVVCGAAGSEGRYFITNELQEQWNAIAPRYKNNPNVIYEVQNEPMGDPNGFAARPSSPAGAGSAQELVAICNSIRAQAPSTLIAMWGFSALGNQFNDAGYRIQVSDPGHTISYTNTVVAFHYYKPTTAADVTRLKNAYPVFMTEGSDEASGSTTDCDIPWYEDCERQVIGWNFMDFQSTLVKAGRIAKKMRADGYGSWSKSVPFFWLKYDDASLSALKDSSGYAAPISYPGGTGFSLAANGLHGSKALNAIKNGNRLNYLQVSHPATGGNVTLTSWVYLPSGSTGNNWIMSEYSTSPESSTTQAGAFLRINSSGYLEAGHAIGSSSAVFVTDTTTLPKDQWVFVAVAINLNTSGQTARQ
jgi:hypothetical protein